LPKIAESLDADLDRVLAELKAKYPPPSPLDEE
jgi:hypothetical protein